MSEEDIQDFFLGEQEVIPVIPRDSMFPRHTVPAYVTPTALFGAFLTEQGQYPKPISATIKLLDFGRGKQAYSIYSLQMLLAPVRLLRCRLLSLITAFSVNQSPRHLPGGAPFHIRPPEVILYDITNGKAGTVWSKEADIWALGCAVRPLTLLLSLQSWLIVDRNIWTQYLTC